ncbi:type VI secretion system baseplate subunit TssK [Lysobacter sp. GX 14042]|uniref:type VI secretion system baseplate subunit TssK n=1 Tax=Lysobacter sp. GX 14042 TaxID=2907155 RepID=UPI001F25D55B|nr:type VI secretion system baseplate subunit TssK [Lysobacter sp. GX 14042]MCE7032265.1 type VI secretion system baseplate subunit TssK [Lysobacter sp. GX 14042]
MSRMSKVLWGEGLFLRPQHFQRQDAYHEARLQAMAATLHPYAWGMRELVFDRESLSGGTLRVQRLSLVFPDGEPYDAPGADELPAPLLLEQLPDGVQSTTIHLGLPLLREQGGNCVDAQGRSARYLQSSQPAADLYTDAGEAELSVLCKSVRLLTDDEPRDGFASLPVMRVQRTAAGGFEVDAAFLPPALSLQALPALQARLRRLLDSLQAKTASLHGHHREPSQSVVEFRSGDTASFWLLHTVNTAHAALGHLHQHPGLHPERLHQELLRLAGGLLTFSRGHTLADLPPYRHREPAAGFEPLLEIIRELLDTVISARYTRIPLEETKPSFHLGRLDAHGIDGKAALYLAVGADLPGTELVQSVPVRFKLGAPDDVEKCVLSALPGLKLTHAAQVPAAVPVRPGCQYFAIEPRGPLYERMLKAGSLSVYVPSGLRELRLELIALTS